MEILKFIGKRLIGIIVIILLFLGFIYLFNGGENYWATVGVSTFLVIFLCAIVGIVIGFAKIIEWAFDL